MKLVERNSKSKVEAPQKVSRPTSEVGNLGIGDDIQHLAGDLIDSEPLTLRQ